jgi:hypothetical protein
MMFVNKDVLPHNFSVYVDDQMEQSIFAGQTSRRQDDVRV